MEILSISLTKEDLRQLELTRRRLGFKSRSKMLRSALQSLVKDYGDLDMLRGNVESVFVLTYPDGERNKVSEILHRFENNIKSELHHHHPGTCIDILNLETTAKVTRDFFSATNKSKAIGAVTYSIVSEK